MLALFFIILIASCESDSISTEVVEEINKITSIEETEEVLEDLPEFLSYGHYLQKEISEAELLDLIDPRIKQNCKFCEFPLYKKNFHFGRGTYTYSDAFTITTKSGEEKIVLMISRPAKKDKRRYKDGKQFMNVNLEIYPTGFEDNDEWVDGIDLPILIDLDEIVITKEYFFRGRVIVLTFNLEPEHKNLLDTCFHILLKDKSNGFKFITNPILVRHCHQKGESLEPIMKEKKKDKLSICCMVYNKDRWMIEWIEWHLMMGVSHFYLYMHQHSRLKYVEGYYDTTFSLLDHYVKEGTVSIFLWNYTRQEDFWVPDQVAAYNDCLWRFRDRTKYMLFSDSDEFLVPYEKDEILSVLDDLEKKIIDEKSRALTGYRIKSYNFGSNRTISSHLCTQIYRWVEGEFEDWQKLLLHSERTNLVSNHELFVPSSYKYSYPSLIEPQEGLFLLHYMHRKWHEHNPIVEEDCEGKSGSEFKWVVERALHFSEELERRVEEMEKKLNVEQYEYEYHDFDPNKYNMDDVMVLEKRFFPDLPREELQRKNKQRWKKWEVESKERKKKERRRRYYESKNKGKGNENT